MIMKMKAKTGYLITFWAFVLLTIACYVNMIVTLINWIF